MSECEGQHQVALWAKSKIGIGFSTEEEARKAAYRSINRKVIRAVNQDGLCDGDCDKGDECLPTWDLIQRNALVRIFAY